MRRLIEPLSILLIALGIVGLCQPWLFAWYRFGFTILIMGTVLFTVAVHLPEKRRGQRE